MKPVGRAAVYKLAVSWFDSNHRRTERVAQVVRAFGVGGASPLLSTKEEVAEQTAIQPFCRVIKERKTIKSVEPFG